MQGNNADIVQQSDALNTMASRIIILANQLLRSIKIAYLGPCHLDGTQLSEWEINNDGYEGPIGYEWIKDDIPDRLKQTQRDAIEAYQIWYTIADQFIRKYNPGCGPNFNRYYNEVLNYLRLDESILDTDNNKYIIDKFNDVFHLQGSILKGTLYIIGNKGLSSATGIDISKEEKGSTYEIGGQQAGRDINQAGRDIIIISNQSAEARSESTMANLEMRVKSTKIYIHNVGSGEATDIKLFIDNIPEDADAWSGFARNDLPFRKSLKPGQETHRLWCGPCFGGPQTINYKVTWKNEDGSSGKIEEDDFRLF